MHESMSDEIDFKTGKVVVDRGHLKRIQQQLKRKETMLDSLLAPGSVDQGATSDEGESRVESEDELAPAQVPKRKKGNTGEQSDTAQTLEHHGAEAIPSSSHSVSTQSVQEVAPRVPNAPNTAANLLQYVQFPQTPLGQEAQAAFYANLNQTIAHAVQQAVAPLLSSVFQPTLRLQTVQAPTFSTPPDLPVADRVKPATDPRWYFPPISFAKDAQRFEHERSSPPVLKKPTQNCSVQEEVHTSRTDRSESEKPVETGISPVQRRRSPKVCIQKRANTPKSKHGAPAIQANSETPQSSKALSVLSNSKDTHTDVDLAVGDPSGSSVKEDRPTCSKYHSTKGSGVKTGKKKASQNKSSKETKVSKEKRPNWRGRIKDKLRDLQDTPKRGSNVQQDLSTPHECEEHFFSSKEIPETSSASHYLPTPNSLGKDDSHLERSIVPSSSHFDDDELELLSLAGADASESLPANAFEEEEAYPTPNGILPSIEGAEFRNEDELQLEMLKTEESDEESMHPIALPSTIPETQASAATGTSLSLEHRKNLPTKPKPMPIYRASSDPDEDLDLIGAANEPATPLIKRESLTPHPRASIFHCGSPALKTPRPVLQSSNPVIPETEATAKFDRRAYLKEVKQSWANNKTPMKRRSLNVLSVARKRVWVEAESSEDELAG